MGAGSRMYHHRRLSDLALLMTTTEQAELANFALVSDLWLVGSDTTRPEMAPLGLAF